MIQAVVFQVELFNFLVNGHCVAFLLLCREQRNLLYKLINNYF